MMPVSASMYGVPTMPMVLGVSPHWASGDRNGGSRVLENMTLPVKASSALRMFWFDAMITNSLEYPGGVYTRGLAKKYSPELKLILQLT